MQDNFGSSREIFLSFSNGKLISGWTFPYMADIFMLSTEDLNSIGNQKGWVETHTKLTDEVHISTFDLLKEIGGSWFSEGS